MRLASKTKLPFMFLALAVLFVAATGFSPVHGKAKNERASTDSLITVPLGGNAWRNDKDTLGGNISNEGIVNWSDAKADFTAYFRLGHTGKFKLYLDMAVPDGKSKVAVSALGVTKNISASGGFFADAYVGEWQATDTGYIAIKINGIAKSGSLFANIRSIKLSGTAIDNKTTYVKNNEGQFYYWGRREPSVHLGYVIPDGMEA